MTKDRFRVTCSYCGFLASFPDLQGALLAGKLYQIKHNQQNEKVEIYDAMAHLGCPELYDIQGTTITVRG